MLPSPRPGRCAATAGSARRRSEGESPLAGQFALHLVAQGVHVHFHGPDLVLTGHVHEPPFKPAGAWADRIGDTWVFNAGRQIGPVPAHIEIDLEAGTAVWRSLMGEERLSMAEAAAPARTVF